MRPGVARGERRVQEVVEGIDGLLVPAEPQRRDPVAEGERGIEVEPAVHVDAEALAAADHGQHRLDALEVGREIGAAHLHLYGRVAEVEIAPHLVLELGQVLAGIVVATGGIDPGGLVRAAAVVAIGEQAPERHALGLRDRVPERHVEDADRDRALAVPAGLLVAHHLRPGLRGIDQAAGVLDLLGLGGQQARDEALAQQPLLARSGRSS